MTKTISREEPFQVLATNFSISPSSSGYTLQISADGVNYTDLFSVGANITRMVTGVANGSYYRLRGNTGTGVVINWRTQCSDGGSGEGGGSTYILPPATDRTLGGVKVGDGLSVTPDGTLSLNGGGDSTVLEAVEEFPQDANIGDAVAKIIEIGTWGWDVPYGENIEGATYTFPADFDITQYNETSPYYLGKFLNTEREGDDFYGYYKVFVFNDTEAGPIVRLANGNIDEAGAGSVTIPTMGETDDDYGSIEATYEDTNPATLSFLVQGDANVEVQWIPNFQLVEGVSLQSVYQSDGIYQYKPNAEWGRWIGKVGENSIGGDKNGTFLVYDYLPEEIDKALICRLHYETSGNDRWLFIDISNEMLYTVDRNDPNGTHIDEIGYGDNHRISNVGIGDTYAYWDKGKKFIRIYANYNGVWDVIDTTVGMGWEKIDKNTTIEFATGDQIISGFPKWDRNGRIVGQGEDKLSITNKRINTSQYGNTIRLYTNGTNGDWGSWYIPTQGGTSGQVLVSNGDAEPTWATMIKAQKITSAAYEALATKDPNTLYLIVNE